MDSEKKVKTENTKNRAEALDQKLEQSYNMIKHWIAVRGYQPSLREMMKELGVLSTATMKYYLDKLEERGYIKRCDSRNRAIQLLKEDERPKQPICLIPLLGDVAAGQPILAYENYDEVYELPQNLFNTNGQVFMLTVKGDSMINAGIYNKDKIVVKQQNTAENSEIVVAMLNGCATVKRFFKEDGQIRLQPENDFMKPIICKDAVILGKVVGLIRNY
ncbi:MAG: transcriptional repressor LexA [Christensenellales bacterium]